MTPLVYGDSGDQALQKALKVATDVRRMVAHWPRPWPWVEPHLCLAMALAQHELGDTDAAIGSLRDGLSKSDPFPSIHATRTHPEGGYGAKIPTSRRELEVALADYLAEQDDFDAAVRVFVDGIAFRRRHFGDDHLQVTLAVLRLGEFLLKHGIYDEAQSQLEAAYEKLTSDPAAAESNKARAAESLVELCEATNRPEEAAAWQSKVSAHSQSIEANLME